MDTNVNAVQDLRDKIVDKVGKKFKCNPILIMNAVQI